MDEETKGWIDLLEARIEALEQVNAAEDAEEKHDANMRVSVVIGALCFLELMTALWAIYETVHHA